jgi:hypothetical protein
MTMENGNVYTNPFEVGTPGHQQLSRAFSTEAYSPEAQFAQFGSQLSPELGRRMGRVQSPLTARWMLQAPSAMTAGGTGSFRDYLGRLGTTGAGAYTPMTYDQMKNRALQAATVAQWSPDRLAQSFDRPGGTLGGDLQRAYYTQQFGAGPQAGQNQRALAQAMWEAKYRTPTTATAGFPGGVDPTLSRAIGNTIASLYNTRLGQGQSGAGFLNWFLRRPDRSAAPATPAAPAS